MVSKRYQARKRNNVGTERNSVLGISDTRSDLAAQSMPISTGC